jgi:hypothetical protein
MRSRGLMLLSCLADRRKGFPRERDHDLNSKRGEKLDSAVADWTRRAREGKKVSHHVLWPSAGSTAVCCGSLSRPHENPCVGDGGDGRGQYSCSLHNPCWTNSEMVKTNSSGSTKPPTSSWRAMFPSRVLVLQTNCSIDAPARHPKSSGTFPCLWRMTHAA